MFLIVENHTSQLQYANCHFAFGIEKGYAHDDQYGYAGCGSEGSAVNVEVAVGLEVYQTKDEACGGNGGIGSEALGGGHADEGGSEDDGWQICRELLRQYIRKEVEQQRRDKGHERRSANGTLFESYI